MAQRKARSTPGVVVLWGSKGEVIVQQGDNESARVKFTTDEWLAFLAGVKDGGFDVNLPEDVG